VVHGGEVLVDVGGEDHGDGEEGEVRRGVFRMAWCVKLGDCGLYIY